MKAAGAGVEQQRRDQGIGLEMRRQESVGAGQAEARETRLDRLPLQHPVGGAFLQRAPPPAPELPGQRMHLLTEGYPAFRVGVAENAEGPRRGMAAVGAQLPRHHGRPERVRSQTARHQPRAPRRS